MNDAMRKPHYHGKPVDLVVDVRSRIEFWTGHLPGAVCIPVGDVVEGLQDRGVPPGASVVVYCGSGQRSAAAAERLREAGFERVIDAGGLADARSHFVP